MAILVTNSISSGLQLNLSDNPELRQKPFDVTPLDGYFRPHESFTELEKYILFPHALTLACLDGNAFSEMINQYMPEAYENLKSNSWLERLGLKDHIFIEANDQTASLSIQCWDKTPWAIVPKAGKANIIEDFIPNNAVFVHTLFFSLKAPYAQYELSKEGRTKTVHVYTDKDFYIENWRAGSLR